MVSIREAKKKDAEVITRLFNSEPFLRGGDGDDDTYDITDIEGFISMKPACVFVYTQKSKHEKIMGVVWLKIWPTYILIEGVVVAPEYRNKGVWSSLHRFIEDYAIRTKRPYLAAETFTTNKLMQSIMKKSGYEKGHELVYWTKDLTVTKE